MIITKTPYRLSLFGGGTDYPAWYEKHPTKIISAAMAHYSYIHLKKLPPFFDHKNRVTYSVIEKVNSINEIDHPSVRECLKYYGVQDGVSITYDGDLPARSGIGSSSAFTVGLINAITTYLGESYSPYDIINDAIHIEQNLIGESVGVQDQIMAMMGGVQVIELSKNGKKIMPLAVSYRYFEELQSNIMLGFSGIDRLSDVHAKKQVDNIKFGKSEKYLKAITDITNEAYEMMLNKASMKELGKLLDKQWTYKRQLTDDVTNDYIDMIHNKAMAAGAYGGKLMGAGGGGFFMFLASPEQHERIKLAIPEINVWVPFKFDFEGSTIIME
jgi:D-glycero-alpha-D-manno-heptose-7-phosphate kinase